MKKLSIFLSFLLSTLIFSQEGIKFESLSFNELLSKAKKENKLIFVDAMAAWCGPCKMMDKNVFSKKEVGDYYNTNFINAKFDMEKGEGRDLAQKYAVSSYPTYLFINGDGQLVNKNRGYMAESVFIDLGKESKTGAKDVSEMRARFEKGEKDKDFLWNIMKLYVESDPDFAKKASERYFKNKTEKEFTKDEVGYLFYFTKSQDDENFKIFNDNKAEIIKYLPEEMYNNYRNQLLLEKVKLSAIIEEKKTIDEKKFLKEATALVGEETAKVELNKLKLAYYEFEDNFPKYEEAAMEYYKNPTTFPVNELLKAAWIFSEKANKPESVKAAIYWAELSVMQTQTSENTYILARLYQKAGKVAEAKIYAETSLQLAQAQKKPTELAEKLLKELK